MRSKGSRFTLGVWGLRVCSLDVAFVVATVRNRSCEDRMAVPMVSSAEVVFFGGFQRFVASFRVAGVALRDIQTCSVTCRKSFCVAGSILLRHFQKMCCIFRGRRSTFDVSIVIFRGRRSTLDVSCCVLLHIANRIGRAASSGEKVQIRGKRGIWCDVLKINRKPRTKHWFWGCKFSGSKGKLVGKRRFWSYKVWKLEDVSHEMLVLVLPSVSSRVIGFMVASPCLWGKLQNLSFCHVAQLRKLEEVSYKMLVFLHPRVLSRVAGFPVASPRLWGSWKTAPFRMFPRRLSCRFACRRGALWHSKLFDKVLKMSKLEEVRTKCSFFPHPCVSSRVSGFSCGVVVSMGEATKSLLFEGFQAGCHVVLRMRSKGSRFTLGVWGLRVCSLGVAFTVATVRNRPQPSVWGPYGRAYGKCCRGGHFWRFPTFRCFVSRGRRGTSWHSDVFCNVSKVVLCGRLNTFATFSEDVLHFSWQGAALSTCPSSFSWQAQHFRRVVLRVYCKSHWQGCVKWRQGANSVASVAFGAMCWKSTEASQETLILRLQIFRF